MEEIRVPLEVPYRRIVVDYLNLIFGRVDSATEWWDIKLPSLLVSLFKFDDSSIAHILQKSDLSFERSEGRQILLHRIMELTGMIGTVSSTLSISLSSHPLSDDVSQG